MFGGSGSSDLSSEGNSFKPAAAVHQINNLDPGNSFVSLHTPELEAARRVHNRSLDEDVSE